MMKKSFKSYGIIGATILLIVVFFPSIQTLVFRQIKTNLSNATKKSQRQSYMRPLWD